MPRGVYQGDKQICRNAKGLTSNSTAIDPGIFLYCKYLSDEIPRTIPTEIAIRWRHRT